MTRARAAVHASSAIIFTLLSLGCPTTYVSLGDDESRGEADNAAGQAGGAAGYGGGSGVGLAGAGSAAGECTGSGAGGSGGIYCVPCAPTDDALSDCADQSTTSLYSYHACLNAYDGVGGAPADQCEGYWPCSYQHEGCLYYYSAGFAGSFADSESCGSEPGVGEWLNNCGGFGYYGPEIAASGAGASAGIGCDPALDNCGGVSGAVGGMAGAVAGGAGGQAAGSGGDGAAGEIGGSGGAGISGGDGGS